ncbi:putative membrane protein (plasmid) [Bacillus cereus E33L]|nr:putative membrane protein [Bacillus cereus E33L]
MIDYYQIFLFAMACIALFFIQYAGKTMKRNKWKFIGIIFLFFLLNYLFFKFV